MKVGCLQEAYVQRLMNSHPLSGPWLCPKSLRSNLLRWDSITPRQVRAGKHLVVRAPLVAEESLPARLQSPVEICSVRPDFEAPGDEDFGDLTLIPVEFYFADRCESTIVI